MPKTAVTRITHSCHLIEIGGRTFLTDPWFTTRPGYYQGEPVALGVADLPHLDGVLISHEHYDHCDLDALAGYRDQNVPLFVPSTVVDSARAHGFTDVTSLAAWEHVEVGGVTVTAAPGKHGVYEITFVLRAGSDAIWKDDKLKPIKGQIVLLPAQPRLEYLFSGGGYVFPRADHVVVGGTYEDSFTDDSPDPERCAELVQAMKELFEGTRTIMPEWLIQDE